MADHGIGKCGHRSCRTPHHVGSVGGCYVGTCQPLVRVSAARTRAPIHNIFCSSFTLLIKADTEIQLDPIWNPRMESGFPLLYSEQSEPRSCRMLGSEECGSRHSFTTLRHYPGVRTSRVLASCFCWHVMLSRTRDDSQCWIAHGCTFFWW